MDHRCARCGALLLRRIGEHLGRFNNRQFCSRVCSRNCSRDLLVKWPEDVRFVDADVPKDFVMRMDRPSVFEMRRFAAHSYVVE
jgi:hypothetical protein